jgi:hypothetical protein
LRLESDYEAIVVFSKAIRRRTTDMGDILSFQVRPRADRRLDQVPVGGAQILFFTGVRYERMEATPEVPEKPVGGGKTSGSGRTRRRRA